MIVKIGYGHLCLKEENLSFNNNWTITFAVDTIIAPQVR